MRDSGAQKCRTGFALFVLLALGQSAPRRFCRQKRAEERLAHGPFWRDHDRR
jgi:hypothetical protein